MLLSKLEIQGFKSFAKKVEIHFDKGITAIIGPNGSGKSNIADAVRWVLGEQSARSLRGSKMEDVIFNGTENRKPQSYCEVALTFDNTDKSLPLEYSEICITRRVYRSGESEYLINRSPCRLRDVLDLFRDTGIGKEGYSIIGQGRVDEILSNKSEERRAVFEEAAGVAKFKVRKEDAERKLAHTRDNLTRIEDILQELGRQLGPLEEQSDKAKIYLKLRDELKQIELNFFLRQYDKTRERLEQYRETFLQLSSECEKEEANLERTFHQTSECNDRMRELDSAVAVIQHDLLSLSSSVEKRDGEAKVILERMEGVEREIERNQIAVKELSEKRIDYTKTIERNSEASVLKQEAIERRLQELVAIETDIAERTEGIQNAEEKLESQKAQIIDAMNRLSTAKSQQSRLTAMKESLLARSDTVSLEIEAAEQEATSLNEESAAAKAEYDSIFAKKQFKAAEREREQIALDEARRDYASAEDKRRAMERELDSKRSRLNVLREMKKDYEGYFSSVRNLLKDAMRNPSLKHGVVGVVAELLKVPKALETAIEMSLGTALQNIVTIDEESAKRTIEHLRVNNYGRATFLPMTSIKARTLSAQEESALSVPGCLGVASDLVEYDSRYDGIVKNLLGRTVIVDDLNVGIAIAKKTHSAFRIATLKGDIINTGGSMTGGSLQKKEFSLLGREREMEELLSGIQAIEKAIAAAIEQLQSIKDAAAERTQNIAAQDEAIHTADIAIMRQREKLDLLEKLLMQQRARIEKLEAEKAQIGDTTADVDEQLAEIDALSGAIEESKVSQQEIIAAQEALSALRYARESIMENATHYKVQIASEQKELSAFEAETRRMEQELRTVEGRVTSAENAMRQGTAQVEMLRMEAETIGVHVSSERSRMDEQLKEIHGYEQQRAEVQEQAKSLEAASAALTATIKDASERKHKAELNASKAELELDNMQNRIWEDYELTYDGASAYRNEHSLTYSAQKTDELKKEIRELGDVYVNAIEDYKNVKERHESLYVQQQDLLKAQSDLHNLIEELLVTMRAQFKAKFALINENFGETFRRLFGGGHAELRLLDEQDVLTSEIQVIAQPPGKKLQFLSLLSGGEKALTAIALLFSMLKLKPTPFCVLDEIEASLDEHNVDNFASYIKQYAENTQFILITHRKGSMTASDTLYGVAMEEKGISRLVSVKMSAKSEAV